MSLMNYLFTIGFGLLGYLLAALPLIVATIVVLVPGQRPPAKCLFVLACGIIVFGISGLLELAALPFLWARTQLGAQLDVDGYRALASGVFTTARIADWFPMLGFGISSLVVPIYGRWGAWKKILTAMANKLSEPTP